MHTLRNSILQIFFVTIRDVLLSPQDQVRLDHGYVEGENYDDSTISRR